jgi:hypothetical protein
MTAASDVRVVLTQSHLDRRLAWPTRLKRVVVDHLTPLRDAAGKAPPTPRGSTDDLAFLSASTATIERIDHAAAAERVAEMGRRYGLGSEDRVVGLTGAHDLLGVIASGSRLVLPLPEDAGDARSLLELVDRERVTHWCSSPGMLEALVAQADRPGGQAGESLRWLLAGGGDLPAALAARVRTRWPGATAESGSLGLGLQDGAPAASDDGRGSAQAAIEGELTRLVAGVLKVEKIGRDDNFFDRGGDSLLGARLLGRVHQQFGVDVGMSRFFRQPTVAAFAKVIAAVKQSAEPLDGRPKLVRADAKARASSLSAIEQRQWGFFRQDPTSRVLNVQAQLRLDGPLDGAALERSIAELVRRHESLRTTYAEATGSTATRVVAPPDSFRLMRVDLRGERDREQALERLMKGEFERAHNLIRGPLFRFALVQMADKEHRLLLDAHHITHDEESIGILLQELAAIYPAFAAGKPSPLPEPELQYSDYAVWEQAVLNGKSSEKLMTDWKRRLASCQPILLPTDRARPAEPAVHAGALYEFTIPKQLSDGIAAFSQRAGCTSYVTLLSAFGALLVQRAAVTDMVVTALSANRNRTNAGVVGAVMAPMLLHADVSGDPAFRTLLGRVRDASLEAYDAVPVPVWKTLPFESRLLFNYAPGSASATALGQDLRLSRIYAPPSALQVRFDLNCVFQHLVDRIDGNIYFNADLFDRATVERLFADYRRILALAIEAPEQTISKLTAAALEARAAGASS